MSVIYDDDISVWNDIYQFAYEGKIIGNHFDIKNPVFSKDRKRNVAQALNGSGFSGVEVSGETDFNFSSKIGVHRQSKFGIYKDILESIDAPEKKRNALKLLDTCKQATHRSENYSLMVCNGSIQTVKGSLDMDRIDVFLYLLDNYYKKKDELILSHCSFQAQNDLRDYLGLFINDEEPKASIYKYCSEIYHISNKKLVDDMVKSGRSSIKSPERVIEYMKLATRFWSAKSKYYEKVKSRSSMG